MDRKIKIHELIPPDPSSVYTKNKFFCVFLGNGVRRYFTNKKNAFAFLAETNRFLNLMLYDLNELLATLFLEYRRAWVYFDTRKAEYELNKDIKSIADLIESAPIRSRVSNSNYVVMQTILAALDSLEHGNVILLEIMQKNNHWNTIRRIDSVLERIKDMKRKLQTWGAISSTAAEAQTVTQTADQLT